MKWIQLIEAIAQEDGKAPSKWRVRLIQPGISENGNDYPPPVLRRAVPLFEGVRALARSDEDHGKNTNKRVKDLVGWFTEAKYVPEGVEATFNISEAAEWLRTMIFDAWNRGKKDFIGFSIVAEASAAYKRTSGRLVQDVREIKKIHFVDVIVNPSAGGEIVGLAESDNPDAGRHTMELEKLLKLIEAKAPDLYKTLDLENITEEAVLALVESVMEKPEPKDKPKEKVVTEADTDDKKPAEGSAANVVDIKDLQKLITEGVKAANQGLSDQYARDKAETLFNGIFSESSLPSDSRTRVLGTVQATEKPATETQIREAIKTEQDYLAKHTSYFGPGSTMNVPLAEGIVDEHDRWKAALLGLFTGESEPINPDKPDGAKQAPYRSFRESYVDLTGDTLITGQVADAPRVGLTTESTIDSATFSAALGDAMHKSMQRAYRRAPYDQWRAIADTVSAKDFRTNHRPQVGGFGDLAAVSQGTDYQEFSTIPDDVSASYEIGKKGNLQPITLEMIANDDVGYIRRMPNAIGRAAMRTLNGDIWNPILANSVVTFGDQAALCSAGHGGNITTSALSPAAVAAGRVAMMKQPEPQSNERLNIPPRYLAAPVDLEQQAFEMCYSAGKPMLNTDTTASGTSDNPGQPNFFKSFNLQPLIIPHWASTNDWLLLADKLDVPMVEVGFFGGKEEPELFIQDMPNVGSMFNADKLIYKVRFIYGVVVLDYRGFYMGNVA